MPDASLESVFPVQGQIQRQSSFIFGPSGSAPVSVCTTSWQHSFRRVKQNTTPSRNAYRSNRHYKRGSAKSHRTFASSFPRFLSSFQSCRKSRLRQILTFFISPFFKYGKYRVRKNAASRSRKNFSRKPQRPKRLDTGVLRCRKIHASRL